jgi:hypothetical protein
MRVEDELRRLFEGTQGVPWPGEQQAFDRFLRRRARRGRVVATAAGLALVAVLGAAVLVARGQPEEREAVAPAGGVVRVPEQGFELPVPAGWRVQRQLTSPGSQVVGVVLVPRSEELRGAAITVAADDTSRPTTCSASSRGRAGGPTAGCTRSVPPRIPVPDRGSARVRSAGTPSPGLPGPPPAGRCRCRPGSRQPARGPLGGCCW